MSHPRRCLSRFRSRIRRLLVACAAGSLALAGTACRDSTDSPALISVVQDTVRVWSLNGSPVGTPNALALMGSTGAGFFGPVAFRASPNFLFDLAVDFDASGTVRLYPVALVGSVLGGARNVGLRRYDIPFQDLRTAPTEGYTFDEPFELAVGDVIAAVSVNAPICSGAFVLVPNIYAKLRVDQIDPVRRTVLFRIVADPNCGYRRLTPPSDETDG